MPAQHRRNVTAVVLAAGQSSRMGYPKALLILSGSTFLARILGLYSDLEVPAVVVLGEHRNEIARVVDLTHVQVLVNPKPERGQLSSLKVALRRLDARQAAIVHPVDHPAVGRQTLESLMAAHDQFPRHILIPEWERHRGHPVLFPQELRSELLEAPLDQGARYVVRKHPDLIRTVPVSDPGVLLNVDTPEQYRNLTGKTAPAGD